MRRTHSRYLINEPALQVQYWVSSSKHERDGRVWVYNTYEEWQRQMPWWSLRTIKRIVENLRKRGVLITTSQYNSNPLDVTLWYAIDYERLDQAVEGVCQVDTLEVPDCHDGSEPIVTDCHVHSDKLTPQESDKLSLSTIYTETTIDYVQESNEGSPAPPGQPALPTAAEASVQPEEEQVADPKKHPLVAAYREWHRRWPTHAQMQMIIESNPPLQQWHEAMRAWSGKGYKPTNVQGQLEWAHNPSLAGLGGTPKKQGPVSKVQQSLDAVDSFFSRLELKGGTT